MERSAVMRAGDTPDMTAAVRQVFADAIDAHEQFAGSQLAALVEAVRVTVAALASGRKLLVFGNGGSAADSQHVAAELVGRFTRERRALAAIALTTDTSVVTSVANDYGYERVFARQIEALGVDGDVVMGITTSGSSPNVLAAFEAARGRNLETIALTGRDGGAAGRAASIHINVPVQSTPRIQEVHRTILHAFCELVEQLTLPR
jgi:D-sedoheptulose 7-phosphate isomerase